MAESIMVGSIPLSARFLRVEKMIFSTFLTESLAMSLSPQENMVSRFSASKPDESDRAEPNEESMRAFLKGDEEFPSRICSRTVRTRTSKESLTSQVSQATQAWYFLEMSSG